MAAIATRRVLHTHRFTLFLSHGAPSLSYSSMTAGVGKGTRHTAPAPSDDIPTSGISRPLSEVLVELGKKVPESYVKVRREEGMDAKYIPWHIVNRIMNVHAPEWSGEVRSVVYAPEGKSVTVVYRVTLHGTDAEVPLEDIELSASIHPKLWDTWFHSLLLTYSGTTLVVYITISCPFSRSTENRVGQPR